MTTKLMWMLGLALASPTAMAAGFQAKTMRETLSSREVERGLLIGKGWLEFGVGSDVKVATGQWDSLGNAEQWDSTRWLYTTERLAIRYGITRRGEFYWTFRTHYVQLTNDQRGTDMSDFGLGDPNFGYKFELFRSMAPVTSLIVYGDYKSPLGSETAGNYIGGPTTLSRIVMSTGTPDVEVGLRGKRQVGPVALTLGAAYVRRLSALTQWAIETEHNQFNARVKPGDVTKVDGDVMVQLGPVALDGGMLLQVRQAFRYGNTADGWFPASNLREYEGSDGWSLDANAGLTIYVTRGIDVIAGASIPLRGEDLNFFPLEDIQPTLGNTYSGTVEFRY